MTGRFSFPPPPPPPPPPPSRTTTSSQQAEATNFRDNERRNYGRGRFPNNRGRGQDTRGKAHGRQDFGQHHSGNPYSYQNSVIANGYTGREVRSSDSRPHFGGHDQHFQSQNLPRDPSNSQSYSYAPSRSSPLVASSPARDAAGHKRKLDALRGTSGPEKIARARPAPPTVPSVPRFGFALPAPPQQSQTTQRQRVQQAPQQKQLRENAKPNSNSLGLTPGNAPITYPDSPDESDSGADEDVDEEALYAELGAKLTIEHAGELLTLSSKADLARFHEGRRRNYPTRARQAEKANERLEIGAKRMRLLNEAHEILSARNLTSNKSVPIEKASRKPNLTTGKKLKSTDQLNQVALPRRPDTATDLGKAKTSFICDKDRLANSDVKVLDLEDPTVDMPEEPLKDDSDHASILSASSVVSSDDDEDDGPEEEPSKAKTIAGRVVPICKFFIASGSCRDGGHCRFRHEGFDPSRVPSITHAFAPRPPKDTNASFEPVLDAKKGPRQSIRDVLLSQQRVEEDALALKVVKYLGGAGFFD